MSVVSHFRPDFVASDEDNNITTQAINFRFFLFMLTAPVAD